MEKKNMLAPTIVLVCICLVASMLLAATYQITKPIIDDINIRMANESRAEVLPEADGFTQLDVDRSLSGRQRRGLRYDCCF